MLLEYFFGVNAQEQFEAYVWSDEFARWMEANCPPADPDSPDPVSFVVLDPDAKARWNWLNPLAYCMVKLVVYGTDEIEAAMAPDGTMENVEHKLRFVLRTGRDSVHAQTRLDLIRPGDFPHQGAGTYKGYTGGVSGRTAPQDWVIYCHLVNKLIEILGEIGAKANALCSVERKKPYAELGTKYLGVKLQVMVPVSEMDARCWFPMRPDATTESDTCRQHAFSAVIDPTNGNAHYRCRLHEGLVDSKTIGEVVTELPLLRD